MRIGIIGAGRVGVTMGKYLGDAGVEVSGFYSKTTQSAVQAAEFTDTTVYKSLQDIVDASDTLMITTPDGVISEVWDCIAGYDLTGKILCHCSGSLSSNVFSGIEQTGAVGCSIHPMYAFSDRFTSYQNFSTAYLVAEGMPAAYEPLAQMFRELGHTVLYLRAENKVKYHAAAAMVSNDMIALFQTVLDLLEQCGFAREDSVGLLRPLVMGNVSNMLDKGPVAALTGPVDRGDTETVHKHLDALADSEAGEVYRVLGKVLVKIAEQKYKGRDDTAMRQLFELSDRNPTEEQRISGKDET